MDYFSHNFHVQSDELSIEDIAPLLRSELLEDQQVRSINRHEWERAVEQGVHLLLAWRLTSTPSSRPIIQDVFDVAKSLLLAESARSLVWQDQDERVCAAFEAAGIPAVLLKGAALGRTHYPALETRPRLDTDLLVPEECRHLAGRLLRDIFGYRPLPSLSGAVISFQAQYEGRTAAGLEHPIDLHWKISNPLAFADVLSQQEVRRESRLIPGRRHAVRVPADVHMLVHLLLHRVAHHEPVSPLLVWLDIHFVAEALDADGWRAFMALCDDRGISELCARGLDGARARFASRMPSPVLEWAAAAAARPLPARFRPYLTPGRRLLDVIRSDWEVAGWRTRAALVRAHVAPPAQYMRSRYGATTLTLPWWYLRRVVAGVRGLTRRGRYGDASDAGDA